MPYWSACLLNAFEDFSEGHEQKQSMERAGSTFVRDQLHIPISSFKFRSQSLPDICSTPLLANLRKYKKLKVIPK